MKYLLEFNIIFFIVSFILLYSTYFFSKRDVNKKKYFFIVTIMVNSIYLIWRMLYTLPHDNNFSLIVGVVLIIAECMGFFRDFVFKILFWKPYQLEEKAIKDCPVLPTVDIFIATYNEPENVLKKTIAAALNLDYPEELKHVYVCDDGRRDQIKELCRQFDVHYVTRSDNG